MAYEQRDNSGSIFLNERKEKETHPDRTGTAMIDGVMYYVSGWLKQSAKGQFLSLAFKRKEEQKPAPKADPISSGRSLRDEMSDDIPF
jgi:hypothetical protein